MNILKEMVFKIEIERGQGNLRAHGTWFLTLSSPHPIHLKGRIHRGSPHPHSLGYIMIKLLVYYNALYAVYDSFNHSSHMSVKKTRGSYSVGKLPEAVIALIFWLFAQMLCN